MLSRLIEHLRLKWSALQTPYRFYVFAAALAVIGSAKVLFVGAAAKSNEIAITGSAILFGMGFVLWVKPWLTDKWQTSHGKLLLTALHAAILFLAVIPSRELVAHVLGLPPQDFEVTVHIFAVELYPALWLLVVAFASLGASLVFLLLAMFCMVSTYPIFNGALLIASRFLATQSKLRLFIESGRSQFISRAFGHVIGAVFVSLGAIYVWELHEKFITTNPKLIRWVAYVTDFHYAKNYPGIDQDRRLRLHENGVVSYAEQDGKDIKITVSRVHE